MQVSVESLGGLQRRMTVQLPAEQVEKEVEERLRRVGRNARIKGFRPGKVPFKVIRQRYGGEVRQDVLSELVRSSYAEAVTQEKLQPAGTPRIETGKSEQGKDFEYTATFEIYPEIELRKVDGLKIERAVADITDADVDRVIDNLREQRAHWHVVERAAAEGDRLKIDFVGRIDGEPFEGGTANDVEVIPGSGQMLADLEQGLVGLEAGATKEIKVKFPKDYHGEDVAGKKAVFEVTVNEVAERHLPEIDDEFCASFGIDEGGLDALRSGVRDNMQRELDEKVDGEVRNQILDALVAANPLDVPQSLVEQEADQLRGDAARQLGIDDPARLPPPEPFMEAARRRVARGLLVGKIVDEQNIEADRAAVDARLEELTAQFEQPQQIIEMYRSDPRLMRQIEMSVIEQKAIDWLLGRAKVKERNTSFQELMQPDAR